MLWVLHSACHLLVLNICMKFYEYILNNSKVIADAILSRNCFLKCSKGRNSKSINTRVMVLALCTSPRLIFIWSFRKIPWTVLKLQSRTSNYKLQRDITQKYIFKCYGSCTLHVIFWWLIFVWSFMNIFWTVPKLQSGRDFVKKLLLKKFKRM